jgi:hypothetical protein
VVPLQKGCLSNKILCKFFFTEGFFILPSNLELPAPLIHSVIILQS